MLDLKSALDQQYSTVNNTNKLQYSTVTFNEILSNLTDVIPNDGYHPFYQKQYTLLGYERFMELANKARAGSDTPQKLFCWMLKNNHLVN